MREARQSCGAGERRLALPDDVLLSVEKPARYIGGEWNSVVKDLRDVDLRVAFCFPDNYEIGMSHLGIQILYDLFNQMEGVWCERVYSPWPDLDKTMRERKIQLFALESQDPVHDFDFLAFTLQYEMCYTNVLQVLDLSGVPILAADRGEDDPLVIGGGPCTYNPEPLADFFDLFYIGEGETQYAPLFDAWRKNRDAGGSREDFLLAAAQIPGIYVPRFYDVTYNEDGTIRSMGPNRPGVPARVKKEVVREMSDTVYPERPVVPFMQVVQDRVTLEIMRGCIRGCRFCQAGMIYRPVRERSIEYLADKAKKMLDSTGHEEITLSSLSSSDYTHLPELLDLLIEDYGKKGINISLPSLRIDAFSLDVMSKVQDVKKSSLTFAPEAGTQRLRDVINKNLTEEDILTGAASAFEGGWDKVKLYFMLGLPTETREDMEGIAKLSNEVAAVYYDTVPKEKRNGRVRVTASSSFFVPKPFTPFQWAQMQPAQEYQARAKIVRDAFRAQLNQKSLSYQWHDPATTVLEGILARGDRRLGAVIRRVYERGCFFEAWTEFFHPEVWQEEMAACGLTEEFYNRRERTREEIFPWDLIDIGVTKNFLLREWQRALAGEVTPNCREKCSGCGAAVFGGGVCFEGQNQIS
ncbi:MAG: TIGR03960 family B12-binding radical SAM protein [Lachnospiraceae bacterium]|nr:TIGR03960 family B12-binding radical SAM protein [Lachnospiraceae bacterium]